NLARQLCEMRPAENSTNNGILEIQNSKGKTVEIPIGFRVTITNTNWQSLYNMHKIFGSNKNRSGWTSLKVTHKDNNPNQYRFYEFFLNIQIDPVITNLTSEQTMVPFANSDFWICDLGLEFFHWPEQKILPNPTNLKRGRSYTLLESTNPNPSTDGYSRVLSYIDKETGGILEAEAYDSRGKLLKEFYPKDVKKVDGQWQLQSMEMDNVQTGSRSWIKFDVKKQ
ncbi:MAG: outer membrane lipoprotein-sorting protein, partial [Limisphaerales bacterium]